MKIDTFWRITREQSATNAKCAIDLEMRQFDTNVAHLAALDEFSLVEI